VQLLRRFESAQQERESALEDVPPEVRAVVEQNEALQRQLREYQQQGEAAKRAEAEKAHQAEVAKAQAEALSQAQARARVLKETEAAAEAVLMF
jgi:hypothetical protein